MATQSGDPASMNQTGADGHDGDPSQREAPVTGPVTMGVPLGGTPLRAGGAISPVAHGVPRMGTHERPQKSGTPPRSHHGTSMTVAGGEMGCWLGGGPSRGGVVGVGDIHGGGGGGPPGNGAGAGVVGASVGGGGNGPAGGVVDGDATPMGEWNESDPPGDGDGPTAGNGSGEVLSCTGIPVSGIPASGPWVTGPWVTGPWPWNGMGLVVTPPPPPPPPPASGGTSSRRRDDIDSR